MRAYMALSRLAVKRSDRLLTFSAFSQHDAAEMLRLNAETIYPILLAADERFQPATDVAAIRADLAERFGVRSPFIYYVGGLDARKNLVTLVRAYGLLSQSDTSAQLVIAGQALGSDRRLFPDLDGLIAEFGLTEVVKRVAVNYEDAPRFYQAATVFAFPSRYEGFGLPPLEAMACGTPTIVADASSLPEVVGPAALRVSPDDVVGWASALRRVLDDPQLQAELRTAGLQRAAQFSWRRVAEETAAVLGL